MRRRAFLWVSLTFCLGLLSSILAAPVDALTVGEILGATDRFDQKSVTLIGTAEEVRPRVSRRGNEYTTFKVVDTTGRINVFSWGILPIKPGDRVEVRGVFQRVKRVGRYTFHNEIEASSVQRVR